jgi:hypothetical protein
MTATLPPTAREKLSILDDDVAEAQYALNASLRRLSDLNRVLGNAPHADGAADLEFEISRLRAKQIEQSLRHREAALIAAHVRGWLRELPVGTTFEDAKPSKAKDRLTSDGLLEAVARVRAEIASLQAERRKVQQAPPPIRDLRAKASDYVDHLVARGRPRITATQDQFAVTFESGGFSSKADIVAILAWLDPKALLDRLHDELKAMPQPGLTLSAKDKVAALSGLRVRIAALERDEEALIEAAHSRRIDIARRPDADPAAILNLVVKHTSEVVAA